MKKTPKKVVANKQVLRPRQRPVTRRLLHITFLIGGLYENSKKPKPHYTLEHVFGAERLFAAASGGDVYKIPSETYVWNEKRFCQGRITRLNNAIRIDTYCYTTDALKAIEALTFLIEAQMAYAIEVATRTLEYAKHVRTTPAVDSNNYCR